MPEFSSKGVCQYITGPLTEEQCYGPTENCAFWVEQVDALKALYSHPCYWSPTDTLGNKMSRFFSKYNGYVSRDDEA